MNNFDICQRIYDNMEHPDYYEKTIKQEDVEAHNLGCCGKDCVLCKIEVEINGST